MVPDVAAGTGDLTAAVAASHVGVDVIGVDFTESMIRVGRTKTAKSGQSRRALHAAGDAMRLAFGNARFDVATIAVGLRNVTASPLLFGPTYLHEGIVP
jgi:demethylmenaquinone methyltransferase/2-methoxy-6-polyprenyl-1,4-benzoquinol methylase